MKKKATFIVTTKVVFKKDDQFLLLKNSKMDSSGSYFDLPGGTVELNEQLSDTIPREIKEELNVDITLDDLELFNTYIVNRNKNDYDLAIIVYVANKSIDNLVLSEEHAEYMYVNKEDIIKLDDHKHIIGILKDVIQKFT